MPFEEKEQKEMERKREEMGKGATATLLLHVNETREKLPHLLEELIHRHERASTQSACIFLHAFVRDYWQVIIVHVFPVVFPCKYRRVCEIVL